MTEEVRAFETICADRNATLRSLRSAGSITLDELMERQAEKVRGNRRITPLRDPEDYYEACRAQTEKLLGEETAARVYAVLRKAGTVCTADHHGALYGAQGFQGDCLFGLLLRKLGAEEECVPILATSQVELGNATYARGISAYTLREQKQLFPLFLSSEGNTIASHARPVDSGMLARFRALILRRTEDLRLRGALMEISRTVFEDEAVRASGRFGDQVTRMGAVLSPRLFDGPAPEFVWLELEETVRPLLLKELEDRDSLLCRLLYDTACRRRLSCAKLSDGTPLSAMLFRAADEKGHKVVMELKEDGFLAGWNWHNKKEVRYPAEPGPLAELLLKRQIFPGVLTLALLTFFERGVTWMGGMFQSSYLPAWQAALISLLGECGLEDAAGRIAGYDCSGYVNGPMFALHAGSGFATPAGPVEFWMEKPSFRQLSDMMRGTGLEDAHRIGLAEMYFDLVPPRERTEGWYRMIAEDLFRDYGENMIRSGTAP